MKKFIVSLLVLVLAAALLAGILGWRQYQQFLSTPLAVSEDGQIFELPSGTSYIGMVRRLQQMGLTADAWPWRLLQRLEPRRIKAGEYRLEQGLTPGQWLDILTRGDVIRYRFTIVEGWTFKQLRAALAADPVLEQTLAEADNPDIMALLDRPDQHPEGWFLPETYLYNRGDSDLAILDQALAAMEAALAESWAGREPELPLDEPYELLILASIIEKETGLPEERDEIAGVFIRRLNKGMRLQTDPTVIYGLGDSFDGDIRYRDLSKDTPYNTYTRDGLPPTPIAMPGRAALDAAANPLSGSSLYFVATGDGGHYFSDSLREHNAAVDRYQRNP